MTHYTHTQLKNAVIFQGGTQLTAEIIENRGSLKGTVFLVEIPNSDGQIVSGHETPTVAELHIRNQRDHLRENDLLLGSSSSSKTLGHGGSPEWGAGVVGVCGRNQGSL